MNTLKSYLRVLNPFHGQKIKRKLFFDEKSRGALIARAALDGKLATFTLNLFKMPRGPFESS